jgi:hypothetical protein
MPGILPLLSAALYFQHLSSIEPAIALKVTSLIHEIAEQFKLRSRGRDIAYFQHKFFSRLLSIATPGITRHASRRASPGLGNNIRPDTNLGQRRAENVESGAPVDAQNLAQRISISMVSPLAVCNPVRTLISCLKDSAPPDPRVVILDDQALMDDLLMQSQDWYVAKSIDASVY